MNEEVIFKRRNRLKKHFVSTSHVLLYCYDKLSDAAKITFQVIDSFDWEDKETQDSKGYVFPAVATIAKLRKATGRTIRRHILELIEEKLLTRIRRRNKPSILLIEDPSQEEIQKYFYLIEENRQQTTVSPQPSGGSLQQIVFHSQKDLDAYIANMQQKPNEENTKEETETSRTDKNVHSEKAGERTKMSIAYRKKENEMKEYEINVNEIFKNSEDEKTDKTRHGMQRMNDIMKRFDIVQPPPAQESTRPKKSPAKQKTEEKMKRDYFAEQIATELQDEKSLGCYRVIAEKVPQSVIFETLASVKETWKEGKIKKSRGALFVDMIKTYCEKKHIDLQFSERVFQTA